MDQRQRLEAAKRIDQSLARDLPGGARIGKSGRHTMRIHMDAVMNAVNTEGREVMGKDADGYWRDQARMYPWIDQAGIGSRSDGIRPARSNRYGRIKERISFAGGVRRVLYSSEG